MKEQQLIYIGMFIGVAFIAYMLFSILMRIFVALGMATPDNRKKFGVRATPFGRFMQMLLSVVIVLIYLMLNK